MNWTYFFRAASDNSNPMFPRVIPKYDDKTYDESEGIVGVDEDRQSAVDDRPAKPEEKAKTTMEVKQIFVITCKNWLLHFHLY